MAKRPRADRSFFEMSGSLAKFVQGFCLSITLSFPSIYDFVKNWLSFITVFFPPAIKAKIKEVKRQNADRKVILQKKRKAVKMGPLKKKELKSLTMYLKNGADCPCSQLENLGSSYLIMGRKMDKQYLITGILKWDNSNNELKQTFKKLRSHKCPIYDKAFK